MNLETVADFGKTPFIYVFVVKYFLNSLSCPIMLNNFYSSTPFRSYITHWFVVGCLFPLLENWVEISSRENGQYRRWSAVFSLELSFQHYSPDKWLSSG